MQKSLKLWDCMINSLELSYIVWECLCLIQMGIVGDNYILIHFLYVQMGIVGMSILVPYMYTRTCPDAYLQGHAPYI